MTEGSNRMFSLRSGAELGTDFPPPQSGAVPREMGWAYEPAPSCRVQLRAAPWCAHFPDYHSSGFGCGCWYSWLGLWYHAGCATRHRALLVVCACTHHFLLRMPLHLCLPSSTISRIIPHISLCQQKLSPSTPGGSQTPTADSLLPSAGLGSKALAATHPSPKLK